MIQSTKPAIPPSNLRLAQQRY